jgi:hypothetical protein
VSHERAPAPKSVGEAVARARDHARLAAAEAVAAFRALLDAAALAASGAPSGELSGLSGLSERLAELDASLREGTPGANALVGALAAALDSEIARWEARSADDSEARAVLRAFLGLRELLWELGVRAPAHRSEAPRARSAPTAAADTGAGASRPRVRRVPVEG